MSPKLSQNNRRMKRTAKSMLQIDREFRTLTPKIDDEKKSRKKDDLLQCKHCEKLQSVIKDKEAQIDMLR